MLRLESPFVELPRRTSRLHTFRVRIHLTSCVAYLGRVVQADATQVTIARNDSVQFNVPAVQIVGKVVISTR